MMNKTKAIVVGNFKGGVGKSTTAINLSYHLSKLGKRVLQIDLDPQCNATSIYAPVNTFTMTVRNIIRDSAPVWDCICHTKYPNIDIIKGSPELLEADVWDMDWLRDVLEALGDAYDFCVIDSRPTFESLTCSALQHADIYLTPAEMDPFCRNNLAYVDELISDYVDAGLKWLVFPTMVNFRSSTQKYIYEDVKKKHCYPLMETAVSYSSVVRNALNVSKPVALHRSKSAVAMDYAELTEELIEIIEAEVE